MCEIWAFLSEIRSQEEGLYDWGWISRDFPMIARKSRTNHWKLTGSSFWTLIAANDSLFAGRFSARYRGD